jgi:hypothetical protein
VRLALPDFYWQMLSTSASVPKYARMCADYYLRVRFFYRQENSKTPHGYCLKSPPFQNIEKRPLPDRSKTAHFPEAETSSDADSRHGRYQ